MKSYPFVPGQLQPGNISHFLLRVGLGLGRDGYSKSQLKLGHLSPQNDVSLRQSVARRPGGPQRPLRPQERKLLEEIRGVWAQGARPPAVAPGLLPLWQNDVADHLCNQIALWRLN